MQPQQRRWRRQRTYVKGNKIQRCIWQTDSFGCFINMFVLWLFHWNINHFWQFPSKREATQVSKFNFGRRNHVTSCHVDAEGFHYNFSTGGESKIWRQITSHHSIRNQISCDIRSIFIHLPNLQPQQIKFVWNFEISRKCNDIRMSCLIRTNSPLLRKFHFRKYKIYS